MKLAQCFTNADELNRTIEELLDIAEEIKFLSQYNKHITDKKLQSMNSAKAIFVLALFFRDHLELSRELIKKLEFDTTTDAPKKQ
jgi:hypothetical protein